MCIESVLTVTRCRSPVQELPDKLIYGRSKRDESTGTTPNAQKGNGPLRLYVRGIPGVRGDDQVIDRS